MGRGQRRIDDGTDIPGLIRPGRAPFGAAWAAARPSARVAALAPAVLGVGALGLAMWRGLSFPPYQDEAAHILGGRVLASGGVLYRDFIDSHGPLMFWLAEEYGRVFGWDHPGGVRLLPVVGTAAAAAMLGASGMLAGWAARGLATGVFCALLAAVWLHQGLFLFDFYAPAGALAVVMLAGFALPAVLGRPVVPVAAGLAGLAGGGLAAIGYAYGPSQMLFAAGGLWGAARTGDRRGAAGFLAGLAAGGAVLLGWLVLHADLRGLLAWHFAESQFVYARMMEVSPWGFLLSFVPGLGARVRGQGLAVLWWVMGAAALWVVQGRPGPAIATQGRSGPGWQARGALLLTLLGVAALNGRGDVIFKDGSFVVAAACCAAAALGVLAARTRRAWTLVALAVAVSLMLAWGADYSPYSVGAALMRTIPRAGLPRRDDSPVAQAIRAAVAPGERMLVLTYRPELYLRADRLPMDGFYAWFRWDEAFARQGGWAGRNRDLCAALATRPPKLLVIGPWPAGWPALARHMPCLGEVERRWRRLPDVAGFDGALYERPGRG